MPNLFLHEQNMFKPTMFSDIHHKQQYPGTCMEDLQPDISPAVLLFMVGMTAKKWWFNAIFVLEL